MSDFEIYFWAVLINIFTILIPAALFTLLVFLWEKTKRNKNRSDHILAPENINKTLEERTSFRINKKCRFWKEFFHFPFLS
jgi:hypothetical protein